MEANILGDIFPYGIPDVEPLITKESFSISERRQKIRPYFHHWITYLFFRLCETKCTFFGACSLFLMIDKMAYSLGLKLSLKRNSSNWPKKKKKA